MIPPQPPPSREDEKQTQNRGKNSGGSAKNWRCYLH